MITGLYNTYHKAETILEIDLSDVAVVLEKSFNVFFPRLIAQTANIYSAHFAVSRNKTIQIKTFYKIN